MVLAFATGLVTGVWWVHFRRVVLDRNTHQGFLNTLRDQTAELDACRRERAPLIPVIAEANRAASPELRLWTAKCDDEPLTHV